MVMIRPAGKTFEVAKKVLKKKGVKLPKKPKKQDKVPKVPYITH